MVRAWGMNDKERGTRRNTGKKVRASNTVLHSLKSSFFSLGSVLEVVPSKPSIHSTCTGPLLSE